jgi:geranylgeranyl diphosphate synthase type II
VKVQTNSKLKLDDMMDLVVKAIESIEITGTPKELYEPIEYILSLGGKRLRPTLVCLSCDAFNGDVTNALHAAKGIEVFHNFSLVHDDIMDNANLRRGKKTIHEKWDNNVAILSGDAMLIKAYDFVLQGKYENLSEILTVFNRAAIEVCEGQQLDMNFETQDEVSIEEYINMIKLKTSVLLGAALKIGAVIGGASKKDSQLMYDFGVNMGIGFQLMDDYLDAFGDPKKFGKKVGGDIISNKKTFLFIKALALDNSGTMSDWLSEENFDESEKVNSVKGIYKNTGADSLCINEMNKYYEVALSKLDEINIDVHQKESLYAFADYIRKRVK